ncbi:MAG: aldehyde dehydrogenase family protein [bacterium]|nr:aldehyde dehydrogenase family protein [bacterium]
MEINGAWLPAKSGRTFEVLNPATGQMLARVSDADPRDTRDALAAASRACQVWSQSTAYAREMARRGASSPIIPGSICCLLSIGVAWPKLSGQLV